MFRHIDKARKKAAVPAVGGDLFSSRLDDSESSSSDSDPEDAETDSEEEEEGVDDLGEGQSGSTGEESDEEEERVKPSRVPKSLLAAVEDPIVYIDDGTLDRPDVDSSSDGEEKEEEDGSDGSEDDDNRIKECLMCPGKRLKTPQSITEHLSSKVRLLPSSLRNPY